LGGWESPTLGLVGFLIYALQAIVVGQIEDFKRFPPRQKPASFNLDAVLRTIQDAGGNGQH
jgi:hypothetical protein